VRCGIVRSQRLMSRFWNERFVEFSEASSLRSNASGFVNDKPAMISGEVESGKHASSSPMMSDCSSVWPGKGVTDRLMSGASDALAASTHARRLRETRSIDVRRQWRGDRSGHGRRRRGRYGDGRGSEYRGWTRGQQSGRA